MTKIDQVVPDAGAVDAEHDVQLQLMEAVEMAVRDARPGEDVSALLDQLISYTEVHFHSEELMMRLYGFPGYEDHRDEHARLVEQVHEMRRTFDVGDRDGLLRLGRSLRDWIDQHMHGRDRGFLTFLRRNKEQQPN